MATSSVLAKMAVEISANNAKFGAALEKSQRDLNKFSKNVTNVAKTIGIAFGVREVASFTLEVSKLAGEADGVRAAFNKLPSSIKLMDDMKRATGGTVSELELMKRAVQAANFDISLEALPKLLEFASVRAQQTGESVDYLVNSIVVGIGRKSKLILDNLGISAVQLDKELQGVSISSATVGQVAEAVGRIAGRSLEDQGRLADTTSTKLQALSASWVNFKVAVGDAANSTGILGQSVNILTQTLNNLSSSRLSKWEKFLSLMSGAGATAAYFNDVTRGIEEQNKQLERQETVTRNVDRAWKEFNGDIEAFEKAIAPNHPLRGQFLEEFKKRMKAAEEETENSRRTLANLKKEKEALVSAFEDIDVANKTDLKNTAARIRAIDDEIEALEALLKKRKELKNDFSKFQRPKAPTAADGEPVIDGLLGYMSDRHYDYRKFDTEDLVRQYYKDRFSTSTDPIPGVVTQDPFSFDIARSLEEEPERLAKMREEMMRVSEAATTMGEAIGDAFASALKGPEEFVQGLARATGQIIEMYLRQSIAAMISKSIAAGGPLPVASIALAAAGIGMVRALFSQIGGGGGGYSSGGYVATGRRPSERLEVGGRIRGYDIELVSDANGYRRSRLG